ncbi:hypothetical protein BC827DRAFT_1225019 [Russula dissimulans]|nr:hypothetical protein BC827DRAFT_1225019 [Russula dissimulans]
MTTIFRPRPGRIALDREYKPEMFVGTGICGVLSSIATRSIYQASFSQTPLLANKLIMQLRTILISTGILALATSLTLGGTTHAILAIGPGKRTNVNRYVSWAQLDILPQGDLGTLRPGNLLHLRGISRLDDGPPIKNVTGDLAIWCEIGDHGWGCYNRKDNKFEFDGFTREYSHSSTLDEIITIPSLRLHGTGSTMGGYTCQCGMDIKGLVPVFTQELTILLI